MLLPVSLLLDPLELGVQEFGSILDGGIFFFVLHFLLVLLDQVSKYCVVDGQSLHRIKLFDQLQTHGASHSIFHKELLKAGGAESMAAVDEDSWDAIMDIVGQTAQLALIFVEKFLHELLNVG